MATLAYRWWLLIHQIPPRPPYGLIDELAGRRRAGRRRAAREDGAFGRSDADGVARAVSALARPAANHDERGARGATVFEHLHEGYGGLG